MKAQIYVMLHSYVYGSDFQKKTHFGKNYCAYYHCKAKQGEDIFAALLAFFGDNNLNWSNLTSECTDGAPT